MTNPSHEPEVSRRTLLAAGAGIAAGMGIHPSTTPAAEGEESTKQRGVTKGRIKQSVCGWCYNMPLEELAVNAKQMGLVGIDLVSPADFPVLKKHGLIGTMTPSHPLSDGLADPQFQKMAIEKIQEAIEATAAEGWKNVICFSGNRRGIDDRTGLKNCAQALKEVVPMAEEKNITLCMELLNSRVDHPDYMCDKSAWGIELCKEVGSDNFKMLYDIYHMQIMEGDIIRSIQDNHQYFGHYHTAGNPGRHELDDTQELQYPPIVRAIIETGFDGYMAQEFVPTRDQMASLAQAVELCDV